MRLISLTLSLEFLTILMQLFSSNVEAKSVTISCATISTAWFSRWCFLTKASLAKTAAPAPSEVGLMTKEEQGQTDSVASLSRDIDSVYFQKITVIQWGSYQHCSRVRKSNTFLDLTTCSKLYSSRNWEYLETHTSTHKLEKKWKIFWGNKLFRVNRVLRVVGGMLVVFPGNFGKVFRFCAWKTFKHWHKHLLYMNMVWQKAWPECKTLLKNLRSCIQHTWRAFTIFLHVLPASVAKHLWCCWSCHYPIAVDHHLHVLVHGIGPVLILKNTYFFK